MKRLSIFLLLPLIFSCHATRDPGTAFRAMAPVIIYKTTADYEHNVPVILNAEKDRVVSYPAPADLFINGTLSLPVHLSGGYLLDRRGINANAAFTKYTYDEYARLKEAPSPEALLESIIDRDPFESMYSCGNQGSYDHLVRELNRKIRHGMETCKLLTGR